MEHGSFKQLTSPLSWLMLFALLAQLAYWHLANPGPTLLGGAERSFETAIKGVAWSFICLAAVPIGVYLIFLKGSWLELGFCLGDWRWGSGAVLVLSLLFLPFLWLGSADASLQAAYPWAGSEVGRSLSSLLAWTAIYALFYLSFEVFYRGFLLKGFASFMGVAGSFWLQVLCSVLIHVGKPLPETLAAIPAGILFGWLTLRTRSLLYPILLHLMIGITTDIFSLTRQGLLFTP